MTSNYKRLGDYIRQVDVRNKDLKVERLLGVNLSKVFIPSVANTIGTDMSKYKIIKKNQFGCKLMSVGRDGIMPISLYKQDSPSLISSAYYVFEVNNQDELLPDFLFMWLIRPEFDRQLAFYAGADVRGGVTWDFLCDMPIIVPAIDRQRELVAQYESLSRRIRINEQMIATLEDTAQALYRKMFVEGIDKENLPEGWRMGTLGDIAKVSSGKTCKNKVSTPIDDYIYPVAGASGIIGFSNEYNHNERILTTGRVGTLGVVKRYNESIYTADNVLVVTSEHYEYTHQLLHNIDYAEITKGGVQSLVTQTDLNNCEVIIPYSNAVQTFEYKSSLIYNEVDNKIAENDILSKLQSLLLAKMGQ